MFKSLALWRITTHLTWVMTNPPRRGMSVTVFETPFEQLTLVTVGHGVDAFREG